MTDTSSACCAVVAGEWQAACERVLRRLADADACKERSSIARDQRRTSLRSRERGGGSDACCDFGLSGHSTCDVLWAQQPWLAAL